MGRNTTLLTVGHLASSLLYYEDVMCYSSSSDGVESLSPPKRWVISIQTAGAIAEVKTQHKSM